MTHFWAGESAITATTNTPLSISRLIRSGRILSCADRRGFKVSDVMPIYDPLPLLFISSTLWYNVAMCITVYNSVRSNGYSWIYHLEWSKLTSAKMWARKFCIRLGFTICTNMSTLFLPNPYNKTGQVVMRFTRTNIKGRISFTPFEEQWWHD